MKKLVSKTAICLLAGLGLIGSQAASAQQKCVKQTDLADAMVYSVPLAYSAYTTKCRGELSDNGFIATDGDEFISRYSALQDQRWTGAFEFLKTFMAKGDSSDPTMAMIASLPPESLRPFVDAMVEMEISKEIKLADCGKIERVLEPLAPLPPENLGRLVAVVMDLLPDNREPALCPVNE